MTADREPAPTEVVRDLLLLCGVSVPVEIVAAQTPQDRLMAQRWAAAEHMSASDNPVRRKPKPAWVSLFEVLEADPDPSATAVGRWSEHVARVEDGQRAIEANESITLALAAGAVMAQQLTLCRMRERFAAALATATAYVRSAGAGDPERTISTMTLELLGSDEAYREFTARLGEGRQEEGEAP
jgi:hypothetical protein